MTQQILDALTFAGREWAIVGVKGQGLFNPREVGLVPRMQSTACYRGYRCEYAIVNDHLILARLRIMLVGYNSRYIFEPGPPVNGVTPITAVDRETFFLQNYGFDNVYAGLNLPVRYTGGLLIGADFDDQAGLYWFFTPADYRVVFELLIDDGVLSGEHDVSARVAEIREKLIQRERGSEAAKDGIEALGYQRVPRL